ncbi:hypothetical protein KR054_006755, partial [Drosophila jambulina]
VNVLVDQLESPWSTRKLVRVLKNNLRPEIRHELLNVDVGNVLELREICRRREAFLDDVKQSHGYARGTPFRREVSELTPKLGSQVESESESELEIDAFSLVCWNCRKEGHRYQDCLSEKRVFCYGCGAANTYKPNCVKCTKNSQFGITKLQLKQKTSNAARHQSTMTD